VLREIGAVADANRLRAPQRKRLRLPLHRDRLQRLVLEDVARHAINLLGNCDSVHGPCALDAGGGVDDIAGYQSFASLRVCAHRHDSLARVDAHAHVQVEVGFGLVQLRDCLEDAQPRAHRSLAVVLVRHGSAERGHDRVTDEFLHRPSVALDLLPQASVVGTDARAHVLGVLPLRGGREADQVAEQDGDDLPLLERGRRRLLGQCRRAIAAEGESARVLPAAGGTDRHRPSLGHDLQLTRRATCPGPSRLRCVAT
jgi:hypothetical protein